MLLSYAPVAFSQPAGNYFKALDTPRFIFQSALRTTAATEVCNNHIDDDNNGLVDDQDFTCYFAGATPNNCKPNSIIWSVSGSSDLYWIDLNTGVQHVIGKLPMLMLDVTWASNGKLYGLTGVSPYLCEIDPNTAAITPVNNSLPGNMSGNSMTADGAGNIYVTKSLASLEILKYNIASNSVCTVADLKYLNLTPAGDLTFLNGMLYQSCALNTLVSINLGTGEVKAQNFTGNNNPLAAYFSIVGMPDGNLYVADGDAIRRVDPVTLDVSRASVVPPDIRLMSYGFAAYNELCQAPTCLGKTSIEAAGNPSYCNTIGVLLKGKVTPILCDVSITGISWTTANGTIVPGDKVKALDPGKYYLNYQTASETCNRVDSFTVQYAPNAPLAVDTSYQLPTACNCNGSITVKAGCGSGNYLYTWNTGATTPTINNVCAGTYNVKVTDAGSGRDTTVVIIFPASPNGVHGYNVTAIGDHCNQHDGSLSIGNIQGGTPPFQYAINNQPFSNTPQYTQLPAGNYSITVKDAVNCALQQQVTISPVPAPQKLAYTRKDAYCGLLTGTIIINNVQDGSPPYTFSVNNGPFNPQTTLANLPPGPGTVIVKDNYGCTLTEPFTIFQSEQLRISISPKDTNICASQPVTFKATLLSNSAGVRYSWNGSGNTGNVFTTPFYDHSKMIVAATDNTGCTATDSATVTAPYCDSVFAKCVLFPNAFSPNRDGLNDSFGPHLSGCEMKSYQLSVYNRWGQLIFQTKDQSKRWNGGVNGQMPQIGTYIYTCQWQDIVGHFHNHKGAVVLLR
ncbi:gliding motility-associated C-terminal domain-containing protein [Niastella yeongjuensis]|nr:gliding motility-associated C-terminal domain-containing protein [Niastella yeongjuensis]